MSNTDLQEIGKRIQTTRRQKGYTQEQIAEMMNVSIQMVSNLERGNKSIRIENLIKLSRILDVSTDYILLGKESFSDISELSVKMSLLSDRDRKMMDAIINYCLTDK